MRVLVQSPHPIIRPALLTPVVTMLFAMFLPTPQYGRPLWSSAPSRNKHESIDQLVSALILPYTEFLRRLEDRITTSTDGLEELFPDQQLEKILVIAGYLTTSTNPASIPTLDGLYNIQSFFNIVIQVLTKKLTSTAQRRGEQQTRAQALWSTLLVPETIAIGLTHTLTVITACTVFPPTTTYVHCAECEPGKDLISSLDDVLSGVHSEEPRSAIWAILRATLWTIHTIWSSQDRRFVRLRRALMRHGFAVHVRHFRQLGGDVGLLAGILANRLGGTARFEYPDGPQCPECLLQYYS